MDLPVNHLAERFEEMCRRQGARLDAELRPAVVKLLAVELWLSHVAFNAPMGKLISVTMQHGAVGAELKKEFDPSPARRKSRPRALSLFDLRAQMGHADIKTTQKYGATPVDTRAEALAKAQANVIPFKKAKTAGIFGIGAG